MNTSRQRDEPTFDTPRGVLAALGLQRRLNQPGAAHGVPDTEWTPSPVLRMALNTGLVAVGYIGTGPAPLTRLRLDAGTELACRV
jgi:hypothetical protein